jgi:hypothetical protein
VDSPANLSIRFIGSPEDAEKNFPTQNTTMQSSVGHLFVLAEERRTLLPSRSRVVFE